MELRRVVSSSPTMERSSESRSISMVTEYSSRNRPALEHAELQPRQDLAGRLHVNGSVKMTERAGCSSWS